MDQFGSRCSKSGYFLSKVVKLSSNGVSECVESIPRQVMGPKWGEVVGSGSNAGGDLGSERWGMS